MTVEIVDFPIENGGSFHSFLLTFTRGCLFKMVKFHFATCGIHCHSHPRCPVLLQDLCSEGFSDAHAVAAELGASMQIHLLVVDPGSAMSS